MVYPGECSSALRGVCSVVVGGEFCACLLGLAGMWGSGPLFPYSSVQMICVPSIEIGVLRSSAVNVGLFLPSVLSSFASWIWVGVGPAVWCVYLYNCNVFLMD